MTDEPGAPLPGSVPTPARTPRSTPASTPATTPAPRLVRRHSAPASPEVDFPSPSTSPYKQASASAALAPLMPAFPPASQPGTPATATAAPTPVASSVRSRRASLPAASTASASASDSLPTGSTPQPWMERHFPALARLGSRIRGDLAQADTPETADTEAGRTALLARLVRSSACAEDIGEQAALNQADDLRPRLHKLLQAFTEPELRALWTRLGCTLPAPGETPARRLYARRLTELQMAFVAGRLFKQDRTAREREVLAAQQDTLRQLDGSEDRLATVDLLGLRLRTLYNQMDRAQVAMEMVGWQELPETESIESAAIRAQVIFSMSTVLRGEQGARDYLLFANSLSDLHGDRPSAWRLQSHMIHLACAHLTADERSRLREQCRGLALQARALFAQGDTERAKDCLRLQEVMLRALLTHGAEGPRPAATATATSAEAATAATAQTRGRRKDPEGKHKG